MGVLTRARRRRRAARWSGPPLTLIAATVLGLGVAPFVGGADVARADGPVVAALATASIDDTPDDDPSASTPSPTSEPTDSPELEATDEPTPEPGSSTQPSGGPELAEEDAEPAEEDAEPAEPALLAPRSIGIVSMNAFRKLDTAQATSDALKLVSRPGVDVIGWQEARDNAAVFETLRGRGWDTKQFGQQGRELAVSWRRSAYSLENASVREVAGGVDATKGRYPFPPTYLLSVTLRQRGSGELLTMLDTHLPHASENLDQPGTWTATKNAVRARNALHKIAQAWTTAPGRWVIGTGDYNFDARSDVARRPRGGPITEYAGKAVSSYAALGPGSVQPTHPYSGRYLDYVHVRKADLDAGRARFAAQRTLNGLNSDHRPLIVWITLR